MGDIWSDLRAHRKREADTRIATMLEDPERFGNFSVSLDDMLLDYSKTSIDDPARNMLIKLARIRQIKGKRDAMFAGERINTTEGRAALHTALRNRSDKAVNVDGVDVMPEVLATLDRMQKFSNAIRSGEKTASDDGSFTDVVNIGIGGSNLGPQLAAQALAPYNDGPNVHFISNVDGSQSRDVLTKIDPKRTLVIIASKSFTTMDTMLNADTAVKWLKKTLGEDYRQHLAAVSNAIDRTTEYGIEETSVFSFADWVGGRYSLWGPVGLSLMLAIGPDSFIEFLEGGYAMDRHFQNADLVENIPVMLALIGIWHNNICDYQTRAILPYDQRLEKLPAYLQQLDMESNGKNVTIDGHAIELHSSPVIWGETGTNAQHAFFQMLHQGTRVVPCEFFIAVQGHEKDLTHHHDLLVSSCFAQSKALMLGRQEEKAASVHQVFRGNRPSTTLIYRKLDPYTLGRMIALFEHRTFVEGCIWDVNSFDQWGVELGKEMSGNVLSQLHGEDRDKSPDASTTGLIRKFLELK